MSGRFRAAGLFALTLKEAMIKRMTHLAAARAGALFLCMAAYAQDRVVYHIDNPVGENRGYYRIGWALNAAGDVTAGWSAVTAIPGWFGAENQGGGIAIGDIDGNGRKDLAVYHIDNPGGENHGYYRVGWNFGQ